MSSRKSNPTLCERIDLEWPELIQLLRALVRAHPCYSNQHGRKQAIDLIMGYLSRGKGYITHRLDYTNAEIEQHSAYVPIGSFGPEYANDPHEPKIGVVAVSKPKDGIAQETIILNGHYDVDGVYDPSLWACDEHWKSAQRVGDLVYGRGATDMLAGLCCLAAAFKILYEIEPQNIQLILSIVPDEELGGNGSLYQLEWLKERYQINPDSTTVLIAEPSDKKVCLQSFGFFPFLLEWSEPTYHAGNLRKPNTVLQDMTQLIDQLDSLVEKSLADIGPPCTGTEFRSTIGKLHGGKDPAIPIGVLRLEGAVFLSHEVNQSAFRLAFESRIAAEISGNVVVSWSHLSFSGHGSEPVELANRLLSSDRSDSSHNYKPGIFPSPCDARVFADAGFPVVIFGPGSLEQAHATNEFVDLRQAYAYLKHLCTVLHGYE